MSKKENKKSKIMHIMISIYFMNTVYIGTDTVHRVINFESNLTLKNT